jgi:hypothetical protein
MMSDMSYDLTVLAADPSADDAQVRAMYDRCNSWAQPHPEGELDDRIVAFYEELRARHPDHPPYSAESPWNDVPLGLGIDHVSMCISYGPRGNGAVELITELARRHGLIIYDPQFSEIFRPDANV